MISLTNYIGLDEVGRWPLAGPATVGGVFCLPEFWTDLPSRYHDVTDSKKLTSWQRSYLAEQILIHPYILVKISSSSNKVVDRYGIVTALRRASVDVISTLVHDITLLFPKYAPQIILDGKTDYGIRKKISFPLETLVKGDALVWQIAAASIVAKVYRDTYMVKIASKKKYERYGFERHKGYGTVFHRNAIARYWLSDIHRISFCKNIGPFSPCI